MKTCGDCIHADLCEKDITLPEFDRRSPAYCEGFRDKADFVEVRRERWDENGRCTGCGGHAPYWCMALTYYKSPFCFECGADMRERRDNDATD